MSVSPSIIHDNAVRIADVMEERAGAIGVEVVRLANGTRLIDAGVKAPGSHEAGRLFAEACLGGLGRVVIAARPLGPATLQEARVRVDHPLLACLGSQYAGWKVRHGRFVAMGSGPARAMAAIEPLFRTLPLRSRAAASVLLLETSARPDAEVAGLVASRCGLPPAALTLVVASTGSLAGSTQIAARSVETALHKLLTIGFDPGTILDGSGSCPIAPETSDPLLAIGRTNDAVLYGADVTLRVRAWDRGLEEVAPRVPSCASRDFGRPFEDLFRAYGDFYKIDPLLFSPARVTFVDETGGRTLSAGALRDDLLIRSFGLAGGARS